MLDKCQLFVLIIVKCVVYYNHIMIIMISIQRYNKYIFKYNHIQIHRRLHFSGTNVLLLTSDFVL